MHHVLICLSKWYSLQNIDKIPLVNCPVLIIHVSIPFLAYVFPISVTFNSHISVPAYSVDLFRELQMK